MKFIRPLLVTDAILTSSNLPENDYAAWVVGSSYVLGARVIRAHSIWEAVQAVPAGVDPVLDDDKSHWIRVSATNLWKAFDQAVGSVTVGTGSITYTLTPGRIDSLAVLDIAAKQVTVTMTVSGAQVYNSQRQTAVGGRAIDNWFDWFFAPIGVRKRLLFDDLPSFKDGVITVTVEGTNSGSPVGIGTLLLGRMFDIGTTLRDPELSITDLSPKVRDAFGVITFVQRAYFQTRSYQVAIDSSRYDAIEQAVADVRTTPTLWSGEDGMDGLLTYGIASRFAVTLSGLTGRSMARLEVESLV